LAIAPASVILLIACRQVSGSVLRRWRPKWTVPFISEQDEYQGFPLEGIKQSLGWTLALLTFTGIGFAAELVHFFPPNVDITAIVLFASWVSDCHSYGGGHFY
jgi:hypothetical protein